MVLKNDSDGIQNISMLTDSTSAVMQLTCHSAQINHSLVHARFIISHVVQGEQNSLRTVLIPAAHRAAPGDAT